MIRWMWWSWGAIAALAAVLAAAAYFAWQEPAQPSRAREFRDYNICLLTGQDGIPAGPAKDALDAMQRVQEKTSIRAPWYQVNGDQTPQRASQYISTLVQQRCHIIVTVGQNQADGVALVQANYPNIKFIKTTTPVDTAALEAQLLAHIPPK